MTTDTDRSLLVLARDALIPLANASTPIERELLTYPDNQRAVAALAALDAKLSQPEVPDTSDSAVAAVMFMAREVGQVERLHCIGKAQGIDVREAYGELERLVRTAIQGARNE